jgi:hypothetical protein
MPALAVELHRAGTAPEVLGGKKQDRSADSNQIVFLEFHLLSDPLAVQEDAVLAAEICEVITVIVRIKSDLEMFA